MTSRLCDHTLLINAIISLTRKEKGIPRPLFQLGYQLECIGLRFPNRHGDTVNPDLSIRGDVERNLLLVDCKSGGVKHAQAEIYARLTSEDIVAANITSLESRNLILDLTFAGMRKNEKKLLDAEDRNKYGLPIVVLDSLSMQKRGSNRFKNERLNELFDKGINFGGKIPTGFYPFSADDRNSYILGEIAPVLFEMHAKGLEFTPEDILTKAHPYHDYLDSGEKDALKGGIGRILSRIEQDPDFRFVISKQKTKWMISPDIGIVYLRRGIQELIEKWSEEEETPKLFEFFSREPS